MVGSLRRTTGFLLVLLLGVAWGTASGEASRTASETASETVSGTASRTTAETSDAGISPVAGHSPHKTIQKPIHPVASIARLPGTRDSASVEARARVDTTIVTGRRPKGSDRLERESSFATRIDLDSHRGPGTDLGEILRRSVGVMIQRYGGPGALSTVSIRGADPGEVEVFLDHVPLRTAARGMVDLSALDLGSLAALEVYRSAPPDGLGGESAGSAIRLVTREGGPTRLSWRTDGGAYDTWRHEAALSGSWRDARYLLTLSRFATEGDFGYRDDNGTPENPDDDRDLLWSNGDLVRENLMARWTQKLDGVGSIDYAAQIWHTDQGLPGSDRQPTEHSRLRSRGSLHRLELETTRRLLPVHITVRGFYQEDDLHYRDPERELAVPGASATEADQALERWGYTALARKPFFFRDRSMLGFHSAEVMAQRRHERLRNLPPPDRTEEDERERLSTVVSVGDRVEWAGGRLHADLFYRWNHVADNYTGSNPYQPFTAGPTHRTRTHGAHAGLRASLGRGHTLKANYADQARFPTFVELFGYAGTIQRNPELRPETGWRADLGWQWDWPMRLLRANIETEAAVYTSRREQMIVLIRISERETKPVNLDRASLYGAEFSWRCTARAARAADGRPAFFGHVHWQHTRDEGRAVLYHGKELTYHPPWQIQLGIEWPHGAWRLAYLAHYRDQAYWSRSNLPDYRTDALWLHEAQLGWRPVSQGELSLRIENLYDARGEDIQGYPLPGRTWYAGITFYFEEDTDQ